MADSQDEGSPGDFLRDVERRQDEVLRELEALEQRLAAILADYAANPAILRQAA